LCVQETANLHFDDTLAISPHMQIDAAHEWSGRIHGFSRPFVLFYWWDRARTAPVQGPIFTINTPYDVIPRKEVP